MGEGHNFLGFDIGRIRCGMSQWRIFFQNFVLSNNYKEAMDIGEVKFGLPFLTFCSEKVPFFVSFGHCSQFLK